MDEFIAWDENVDIIGVKRLKRPFGHAFCAGGTASNTHFDDMESNAFEYFHSAIVENHDNYMQA